MLLFVITRLPFNTIFFRHPFEHEISEFEPNEHQLERKDAQVCVLQLFYASGTFKDQIRSLTSKATNLVLNVLSSIVSLVQAKKDLINFPALLPFGYSDSL